MPEIVTVKVSGLDQIEAALERAPLRVARRILRDGLLRAAEIWRQEMVSTVRRGPHRRAGGEIDFGVIADNIDVRASVTSELEGKADVGPAKDVGGYSIFWAKFLEFGTRVRRRKGRRGSSGSMPPFPFIRSSFEARKGEVLEEFASATREACDAEGLKLS